MSLGESWLASGFGPVVISGDVSIPFVARRMAALGIDSVSEGVPTTGEVQVVDTYDERERAGGARAAVLIVVADNQALVVDRARRAGVPVVDAHERRAAEVAVLGAALRPARSLLCR
jgi:hypothetical protein